MFYKEEHSYGKLLEADFPSGIHNTFNLLLTICCVYQPDKQGPLGNSDWF